MSENNPQPERPEIQIDTDWKTEAQREKQRLAEKVAKESSSTGPTDGTLPPADFQTLVSTMVSQALMAMGAVPDPATGRRIAILDLARFHIDLLGVLEEKTKGNLTEEEAQMLSGALNELRMQYVHLSQQAAAQMAAETANKDKPATGPGADLRTPGT